MKNILLYISSIIAFFLFIPIIYSISNITIKEGTLIPYFNSKIYKYNLFLDEKTEYLNLSVTKDDTDNYIIGDGRIPLTRGINEIIIEIVKKDESIVKYYITANRGYRNEKDFESATLKSLEITNHTIDFDPNIFEYTIDLSENENELEIDYLPTSEYSKVILEGNSNLILKNNIISIIVKSYDEKTINTYTIYAHKIVSVSKEEKKVDKNLKINETQKNIITIIIFSIGFLLIIILFKLLFFKKKRKTKK